MKQKPLTRPISHAFVEALENRMLLSAGGHVALPTPGGESRGSDLVVDRTAKASRQTTTTLHVSRHLAEVGQPIVVTVQVKAAKGAARPAGTVQFIDNGATVQSDASGPLTLTLSPAGRASYAFQVGNIALYVGLHSLSALFGGNSSLFGSISKSVPLLVRVPKLKRAVDGFAKATIKPGRGKATVRADQTATVSYTGFLQGNGDVFDYAAAHAPASLTFVVEASPEQVIPGFDRGVLGMKVGETRVLVIPAALAYGSGGAQGIPPNADLLFLVKLLSIT